MWALSPSDSTEAMGIMRVLGVMGVMAQASLAELRLTVLHGTHRLDSQEARKTS